ncbi:MAG: peptidylprolyl isomerase [Candidatus Krumholzibacteriia bacterium]
MRRGFGARALGAVAVCLLLAIRTGIAPAEREPVDRVVAMVDDEAILLSDVLRKMDLIRLQRNLDPMSEREQEALFRQVLSDMIDDQLLVAQAKEKGFEVGDQELRDAVEKQIRAIKDQLGGEEKYREELERQGLTEAEIRDIQREQHYQQILAARVIQSDVRRQVSITDDQVQEHYATRRDSIPELLLHTPQRLRLANILIAPRTDESQIQKARAKMNLALGRIEEGEDFAKVAQEMSEWPTARNGGYMGRFRYGDFESDAFDEVVSKLEPGEVSTVVETRFGLMVIKLESRDGDVMAARHIVVKTDPDENARVEALERAEEVRRRLLAGESFEELARKFSDDPISRENGGVLENEWIRDDLRPPFRAAIDSVDVGGVTSIVNTPNGLYIFKILERIESHETTFEEIQEPLRRYLEQKVLEERLRTYLDELRQRFYVDIKA